MRVDGAALDRSVELPDVEEERVPRLRAVLPLVQGGEQPELQRRELDLLVLDEYTVGGPIDLQAAELDRKSVV